MFRTFLFSKFTNSSQLFRTKLVTWNVIVRGIGFIHHIFPSTQREGLAFLLVTGVLVLEFSPTDSGPPSMESSHIISSILRMVAGDEAEHYNKEQETQLLLNYEDNYKSYY